MWDNIDAPKLTIASTTRTPMHLSIVTMREMGHYTYMPEN